MSPHEFIAFLFDHSMLNEHVQFVFIHPDQRPIKAWSVPNTGHGYEQAIANACAMNEQGYGVYYRMCTMPVPTENNIRGTADAAAAVPAFWIDIDSDKRGTRKGDDFLDLTETAIPPTAIIDSGGGLHAYWILDEAVSLTAETRPVVRSILRGLAKKHGSDIAVAHTAAVLRVPGFHNTKPGRNNAPVYVAWCTEKRVSFGLMKTFAEITKPPRSGHDNLPKGVFPKWVSDILTNPPREGQGRFGGRDNDFFRVACWMYGNGYSEMQVRDAVEQRALSTGLRDNEVNRLIRSASSKA